MKKYFISCLLSTFIFTAVMPLSAEAFLLSDPQPLFSAVQTESEVARLTNYPVWLRSSLEMAGWIKKGQLIDAKTALSIEKRLCREFLQRSESDCQDTSLNYYVISSLSQFSSLDRKSAPDTLLTNTTIKTAVREQLEELSSRKSVSCPYSLILSLVGTCGATSKGDKAFPGVTKAVATKHVSAATAAYESVRQIISKSNSLSASERKEYLKEFSGDTYTNDLKYAQAALSKKRYTEAFVAGVATVWLYESLAEQVKKELEIQTAPSKELVAEQKKNVYRELESLMLRHGQRGSDSAYLLRYGNFARNLRTVQLTIETESFAKRNLGEQLVTLYIALDMITLVDLGAKARI
jgi:hypothetical protein